MTFKKQKNDRLTIRNIVKQRIEMKTLLSKLNLIK